MRNFLPLYIFAFLWALNHNSFFPQLFHFIFFRRSWSGWFECTLNTDNLIIWSDLKHPKYVFARIGKNELKSRLASLSRALRDKKKYTNEKSKLLFQKYVLIFPICLSFPMMINRFPLKRFCVFSSEYTWECVYIISLQFINLKGSWASVKSKHMSPVWKARERNDSPVCGWVICFPVQKSSELTAM